jgi:hypothetical protein
MAGGKIRKLRMEQKMSRQSIYAQNKALNDARRKRMHSQG